MDEVENIIFTSQNTGGTTTYEWTNDNISISDNELAGSGSGDTITGFTATNSSLSAQTASIQVTPTFTSDGNSSVGTPIEFTITVNPDATVVQPDNFVFCNGDITELISFETLNTDGVVSFNWTNDNISTGLTETDGVGEIPVFNATNNTNEPIVSTILVYKHLISSSIISSLTPFHLLVFFTIHKLTKTKFAKKFKKNLFLVNFLSIFL